MTGGRVRLLRPEEVAREWDPDRDEWPSVWGMAHQLVRVYYYEKRGG
jgi:putative DNA methylase